MKKTVIGTLALIFVFLGVSNAFADAPDRKYYNGHWYQEVYTTSGRWDSAQNLATALGGNLVTINDETEQQWLRTAFNQNRYYWIGFNDAAQEGVWKWISGEPVTYTNWDGNNPNNEGVEDWAVMNWDYHTINPRGTWNDWKIDGWGPGSPNAWESYYGIAEGNSPVPEPATMALFGFGAAGMAFLRRRKTKRGNLCQSMKCGKQGSL